MVMFIILSLRSFGCVEQENPGRNAVGHIMMKASVAFVCAAVLCGGCAFPGPAETERILNEDTAGRIAVVIEDVVAGVRDMDDLPSEVDGVTVDTEKVRNAVETRRVRYKSVVYYKDAGCIGENRRGLVERRNCEACQTRKQLDLVAIVVITENDDRRDIYRGIRDANRMPSSARATLMAAFRAEHQRRAAAGEWYETKDGQWLTKR